MYVTLFMMIDELPDQFREQAQNVLPKVGGYIHTPAGDLRSTEGLILPGECILNFNNETLVFIQEWIKKLGLKVVRTELREMPCLDDRAILPWRGLYRRRCSDATAVVDSFTTHQEHESFLEFSIIVRGTVLESVYDLYRVIRTRDLKPYEPWDVIPEE